jgi:hypothetical protein
MRDIKLGATRYTNTATTTLLDTVSGVEGLRFFVTKLVVTTDDPTSPCAFSLRSGVTDIKFSSYTHGSDKTEFDLTGMKTEYGEDLFIFATVGAGNTLTLDLHYYLIP